LDDSAEGLAGLIASDDNDRWRVVFEAARQAKEVCGKSKTLKRALIEVSNQCACNCLYCGIRRNREGLKRYHLTEEEALQAVHRAIEDGFTAVAFQAGELRSEGNTRFYESVLKRLPREVEVTLSLGEQEAATYSRWREAAGDRVLRYLLRIEASDPTLFAALHPAEASYTHRLTCIRTLKALGYVTGTGVLIGVSGQTARHLAEDLLFFRREHVDMVGMGPYVPAPETPLGNSAAGSPPAERRLELTLRMIALTRLLLGPINIVASTAVGVIGSNGCDRALAVGANVIMPNYTPTHVRADYALYPGKNEVVS